MQPLNRKVIIVTGGSRGMGRHFVDVLVANGAQVACLARPSAELDALALAYPGTVAAIGCDVADSAQVNAAVAAVITRFGRIDVIVNNAAIFHPFLLEKASDAQVQAHFGVNVLGAIWLTRAAIPHLRASKGQIISISSESVRMPFPMLSVYAATKAAIETMSQALRDELRADDIRVSVLRSGSVAGGTGARDWPEGIGLEFYQKISETGHAAMAGDAASPTSMAQALLALVTLPADVNIDMLEARAARAGVPEGVAALTRERDV